jgi:hypothetical protein
VGKVVTAVRQFDQTAPGRRWLRALHKENRWTRWLLSHQEGEGSPLLGWALLFLLFFGSVVGSYYLGYDAGRRSTAEVVAPEEGEKDKMKEKADPIMKQGREERPAGGK